MLQAMREGAGAKVLKIFLMSFLVLAVGGLVLSDVGGFFRGGVPSNTVAKGSGISIGAAEFDQTVRRVLAQRNVSPADAYQRGLIHQILTSEIQQRLLTKKAADLGLHTSDDVVTAQMAKIAQQIAPAGGGSRADTLKMVLRSQGITEAEFVESIRQETANSVLRSALAAGGSVVPAALADDLFKAENQKRDVKAITLKTETIKDFEAPTDENLEKYYEANKALYAQPETRTITIATLSRAQLEDKIVITDEDVRKAYDDHIATYTKPAERVVALASFATEADANKAVDAVKGGKTLKQAAGDKYMDEAPFQANPLASELNEPIAKAKEGDIVGPIKTALGYYVASVRMKGEEVTPFEDSKKLIREEILQARLMDDLLAAGNDMDDRLASGEALETIVKDMGLTTQKIGPFRQNGADANNKDLLGEYQRDKQQIIDAAFDSQTGETAPVIETADSRFLAVRIDDSTPLSYKPFESVKEDLRAKWIADQKKLLNESRARDAQKRLQAGETLETLAKELGVPVQSYAIKRGEAAPKGLGPVAVTRLFTVGKNDYILAEQEGGVAIAAVTDIVFPSAAKANDEDAEALKADLSQETIGLFVSDLASRGKVKVNEKLLQQMYLPTTNGM